MMIVAPSRRLLGLLVTTLLLTGSAAGQAQEPAALPLEDWLLLGPVATPLPAFHGAAAEGEEEEGARQRPAGTFGVQELLAQDQLPLEDLWPAAGESVAWPGAASLAWKKVTAPGGELTLEAGGAESAAPRVAYLATYLDASRFTEAQLKVTSPHRLRIFLNGEQKAEKKTVDGAEKEGTEPGEAKAKLALTTGKHLLLLRVVWDPKGPQAWTLRTRLEAITKDGEAQGDPLPVVATADPRHKLRLVEVLDVDNVRGLDLSADGEVVALQLRRPATPSDFTHSWTELRSAADGRLLRTLQGGADAFAWAPEGRRYAYVVRDKGKATLWQVDLESGENRRVFKDVEDFGGFVWSPRGDSLFVTLEHKDEKAEEAKKDGGFKQYRGLNDRWPSWRHRATLYQVSVRDGLWRRLTAGGESISLQDVSPDGRRLLVAINRYDVTRRPFNFDDLYELDLDTLEPTLLRTITWFGSASYAPDGERILVLGGPSSFGPAGVATAEGVIPNEYDTQAYVLHRGSGQVDAITRGYDPSVLEGRWSRADGRIYLRVQVGSRAHLAVYEGGSFSPLPSPVEAVAGFSLARTSQRVVFYGSSANQPERVFTALAGAAPQEIYRPAAEVYEQVEIGRVETWEVDVEGEDGGKTRITGRIHYPPDFDPARQYPLIVYYYGGTVPEDRSFGGRYPKDFWAANGYVVLVPQPSGAVGFGQEMSARHVNDWGVRTSREIVASARQLIARSDFLSEERVGCIGASYGGFMTLYLLTHTDLCRAAVSHAGISALSSYWGEGWWGYIYSAVASAESYPWNRPDLYVGHSPLFAADEVEAPLLLLHGDSDTNVPVGESFQFYAALQILGKDVELITFDDEDHRVVHFPRRMRWSQTIVAWFDRHLKGQPEYWRHLYPEVKKR